jgi:serine/threonine protein phosphatase PrpC
MKRLSWQSCGLTDKGIIRQRNEDNFCMLDNKGLWLIADGAGGHANGHIASQIAVDTLSNYKTTKRLGNDSKLACSLLHQANDYIVKQSKEQGQISGSTASIFLTEGKSAVCIWAGDSPIYRFRKNKLIQLSQDHNRIEEFMQQGFSLEESEKIPAAHYLTQALGAAKKLCLQTRWIDIQENDHFIIASDGLTKELLFSDIEKIVNEHQGQEKIIMQRLISETINRGARDNVTVIVIFFIAGGAVQN